MRKIRNIAHTYDTKDICNMDETGLYWKMMPSRGLSLQSISRVQKDKIRITAAFCVIGDGTNHFPIWFVGRYGTPRALRNINVQSMGGVWRHSEGSWMTRKIMEEWLSAFYRHIRTERKVLLTMDNFSGHKKGPIKLSPPPNIIVIWLQPNTTS